MLAMTPLGGNEMADSSPHVEQQKSSDARPMNCYLASPPNKSLEVVARLLKSRHVEATTLADSTERRTLLETARRMLGRADFACFIDPLSPEVPNLAIELGIALGRRVPTLIVLSPGEIPVSILVGVPYVTADPGNEEALASHLDIFMARLKKKPRGRRWPPPAQKQRLPWLQDEMSRLESSGQPGRLLEDLVVRILRSAGGTSSWEPGTTELEPAGRDRGVDIAAWLPALEPTLSNPVLIQVKAGALSPNVVRQAARRFGSTIRGSELALLVYWDRTGKTIDPVDAPFPILCMSVEGLARRVEEGTLISYLIARRNAAAHGITRDA
jgi:hypothetical protein